MDSIAIEDTKEKDLENIKILYFNKIDNCVLYYNLVNDTLLSLPEALEEGCVKCLENPNNKDTIYWRKLYNDRFIVDDNYDEMKEIQRRHWRTANTVMSTALGALYLKCIVNVPMLSENLEFEYAQMTESDFDGLYEYLCKVPQQNIHINWFGGEPMLLKTRF